MAIAVEVAKLAGWRLRNFPGLSCHEIPFPSMVPTLGELLDNSAAYAKSTQERLTEELGLPREPTLIELLDDTLIWAQTTRKRLRAELGDKRRKKK